MNNKGKVRFNHFLQGGLIVNRDLSALSQNKNFPKPNCKWTQEDEI